MKIIGKAEGGYLIQAAEHEINALLGETYINYRKPEELDEKQKEFKERTSYSKDLIGFEFPIHQMYEAARIGAKRYNDALSIRDTIDRLKKFSRELEDVCFIYDIPVKG